MATHFNFCRKARHGMKKKILFIIVVAIIFGIVIISLILRNKEDKSYVTILSKNKTINYFVIQFKANNVKLTDENDVKIVTEMFDEKVKRNEKSDDKKGWIYKITSMDSNDNQLETLFIIDDTTIKINGKTYTCKKINLSVIDKLTGIRRD